MVRHPTVAEIARKMGISEQSFYRWKRSSVVFVLLEIELRETAHCSDLEPHPATLTF
jgi:transposase-like protein